MTSVLTPPEFREAWSAEHLTRLPSGAAPPSIPAEAAVFLTEAGLPKRFVLAHPTIPSTITFNRLSRGLTPLLAEPMVGPPPPREWSPYLVLGDEKFDETSGNAGAWYCIEQGAGHVLRVDPELDNPVSLVNTSVPRFASSMLAAVTWSSHVRASSASWRTAISFLTSVIEALDPVAFDDETSHWRLVVQGVIDEKPGAFQFFGGPSEGSC